MSLLVAVTTLMMKSSTTTIQGEADAAARTSTHQAEGTALGRLGSEIGVARGGMNVSDMRKVIVVRIGGRRNTLDRAVGSIRRQNMHETDFKLISVSKLRQDFV